MSLMLRENERLDIKGRSLRVTRLDLEVGPRVRDLLIEVARQRKAITYGELKSDASLTHAVNGIGRLLDVLSEDCRRRGEPSLAPVVVNASTGEVGADYLGNSVDDRRALYEYWG